MPRACRACFALAVVLAVAACGDRRQGPSPSPTPPVTPTPTTPAPDPEIARLNATAGTASLARAERCAAVFALFEHHLAPGVAAPAAAAVITDRSWITVDDQVEVLGGWIPVELTSEDSTFVVHCVAAPNPDIGGRLWSDWVIYGRIRGKTAPTFTAFLAAGPDVALIEYATVYPDGRIERFAPPPTGHTTIKSR